MNFIKAGHDSTNHPVELAYQDVGTGKPVVLIHGWPVSLEMWEYIHGDADATVPIAASGEQPPSFCRRRGSSVMRAHRTVSS